MYYPRKTVSRRQKAFEMYRNGASHDEVVATLGILRNTAIGYKGEYLRAREREANARLISVNLYVPAVDYMRCRAFERWLQEQCVPVFFGAAVKSPD
jgi:hypothetical protein